MSVDQSTTKRGLLERLDTGPVIVAEGYLFEFERRGYLQAGAFVPEVVLEHPEAVRQLHIEFARAGSDVMEAFTYYAHREKMRLIGREGQLEEINRNALQIAKDVADDYGTLLAGNICNTNLYDPADPKSHKQARAIFEEQVQWAVDAGVDMIIGETYSWVGEAMIALEVIEQTDLPSVMTLALHREPTTRDGIDPNDGFKQMHDAGADVVGYNCIRGPWTMVQLLPELRQKVPGHLAALPVPYRTLPAQPTFQSLRDPGCNTIPDDRPFPVALDPFVCNRYEMADFARQAYDAGVHYIGGCCGTGPHHVRAMAEALGRQPEASRYSVDMSKHAYFGTEQSLKATNTGYADQL